MGTVTFGVVGLGVTLIDVQIENLEIYGGGIKLVELQYVDALAAVGYASVASARRTRHLTAGSECGLVLSCGRLHGRRAG